MISPIKMREIEMVGKLTDDRHLSASRMAAVLGHDPWSAPNDELLRSHEARQDIEADYSQSEPAEWGDALEAVIVAKAAARLGTEYLTGFTQAFPHERIPLACSIDGHLQIDGERVIESNSDAGIFVLAPGGKMTLVGDGVIEAKLTSMFPEETPPLHRGPIQAQAQMMCTGCKWAAVAVLYRGIQLRIFLFEPHLETELLIEGTVLEFERRLEQCAIGADPDWYEIEDPAEAARIYPYLDENAPTMDLPLEMAPIINDLLAARKAREYADEIIAETSGAIMEVMGNHERSRLGNFEFRWPVRHYKDQPEKTTPAKIAYSKRQASLTVVENTREVAA